MCARARSHTTFKFAFSASVAVILVDDDAHSALIGQFHSSLSTKRNIHFNQSFNEHNRFIIYCFHCHRLSYLLLKEENTSKVYIHQKIIVLCDTCVYFCVSGGMDEKVLHFVLSMFAQRPALLRQHLWLINRLKLYCMICNKCTCCYRKV